MYYKIILDVTLYCYIILLYICLITNCYQKEACICFLLLHLYIDDGS